jgi:prevent-host-death family protein
MPVDERTHTEIGAFEAKTRLSEILRKVEQGERFTITVRGRAVADVVPVQQSKPRHTSQEMEAAFQRLQNPRIKGISPEEIRAAIEYGRR